MVFFESLLGASIPIAFNALSASVISAIGFTTSGIVAGSTAALIQSGLGAVASGSVFAGLQSMGALGVGILGASVIPLAIGGAILTPLIIALI